MNGSAAMADDRGDQHPSSAPQPAPRPEPAGALDGIDIVEPGPGAVWSHDGAGYPPEAGLADLDPDRLPEHDGMAEDEPEPPAQSGKRGEGEVAAKMPSWAHFGSHLEELRKRLVISLCVFAPLFGIGVWLYRSLWQVVILPLERAAPHLLRFQALNPSDGLVMAMRSAFAFALFLSMPVWLAQAWHFVAPGLTARERRWLHLAFGSGGVLFAVGAALAYFLAIPYALEYLLPFNQSLSGWENAFTGEGYVDFVITCCAGFGFAFELPLAMLVLGWAGILTSAGLRQWWRPVVLCVFVLAAIMTPPDPFTQSLLAIPMLVLFLIGYCLVKWTER